MRAILPSLDHFLLEDYENFYEPSDDTFLICDAIEQDRQLIKQQQPQLVLEIGAGSGCVISFLSMLLRDEGIKSISMATDINIKALEATQRTASANNIIIETVQCDLVFGLEDRVFGKVDILLFNPPYVVTPSEEIGGNGIEASWAGGVDGREVIDRLLPHLSAILSPSGVCYMVLVRENKPADIVTILNQTGLMGKIVIKRTARNEELLILKIFRTGSDKDTSSG